jgi:hypothetical protein
MAIVPEVYRLEGRDAVLTVHECPVHPGGVMMTLDTGQSIITVEFQGAEALDVADALRHYYEVRQ